MELYENIRKRRTELKMTQAELAQKCGYKDRSMIAQIERGAVNLSQGKIWAIADALRTTPAELMGLEGTYEGAFLNRMLMYIESLNQDGINKLEEYASDLSETPKYKK